MLQHRHGDTLERHGGVEVLCDNSLQPFVMKVDVQVVGATGLSEPKALLTRRVAISEETWQALCDHPPAEEQFYDDLESYGEGILWAEGPMMRYLVTDSGKYGEAARAALAAKRAADAPADVLAQLSNEIKALVAQAAEMRSQPSRAQAASFGHRLGELGTRLAEQRQALAEAEALLDFAKVAVLDAADLAPSLNGRKVGTARSGS